MEIEITPAKALELLNENGGYGATRVYGIIASGESAGQITAIKSEYHLNRYEFSSIYTITRNGYIPIHRA